jgi:hypothetical protein
LPRRSWPAPDRASFGNDPGQPPARDLRDSVSDFAISHPPEFPPFLPWAIIRAGAHGTNRRRRERRTATSDSSDATITQQQQSRAKDSRLDTNHFGICISVL